VAAVRVTDKHDILVFSPQRSADNIRVAVKARRPIFCGQVHSDDLMARSLKERSEQLPGPRAEPGTMHQRKSCHAVSVRRPRPAGRFPGRGRLEDSTKTTPAPVAVPGLVRVGLPAVDPAVDARQQGAQCQHQADHGHE